MYDLKDAGRLFLMFFMALVFVLVLWFVLVKCCINIVLIDLCILCKWDEYSQNAATFCQRCWCAKEEEEDEQDTANNEGDDDELHLDRTTTSSMESQREKLLATLFPETPLPTQPNQRAEEQQQLKHSCSICTDDFQPGSLVHCTTNCGHFFHGPCVRNWVVQQETSNAVVVVINRCPNCNGTLLPQTTAHTLEQQLREWANYHPTAGEHISSV